MDIKTLTLIFLGLRLVSMVFIVDVIKKQVRLLRRPVDPKLKNMRMVLLGVSLVIFLGNLIPIGIDIATQFVETGRPTPVRPISVAYGLSSNIPALLSSILIWLLYKMAEKALKEGK